MGEVLSADEVLVMQTKAAQSDHAWPANHAFYMPEPCCEILTQWLYPVSRDLLALARSHEQLREQRDEINRVLTGLTRIGLTEPEDHVFRFFQRLHGLPETGGPSGPTWKERAVAAEAAVRAAGNAADALRALVTICRDCREKPADWLMWGKLFPEHQLGFKCDDCAHKAGLGWTLRRHDQSALIDCRPAREALAVLEPEPVEVTVRLPDSFLATLEPAEEKT